MWVCFPGVTNSVVFFLRRLDLNLSYNYDISHAYALKKCCILIIWVAANFKWLFGNSKTREKQEFIFVKMKQKMISYFISHVVEHLY